MLGDGSSGPETSFLAGWEATIALWMQQLQGQPLWLGVLLGVAGTLAGLVNSMAGGGSFFTVPVLIAAGIEPVIANGTIRVGALMQNIAGTWTFGRRGLIEWSLVRRLLLPMCVGAWLGAMMAIRLDNEVFRPLFGIALLVWALLLLFRPGRFIQASQEPRAAGLGALLLSFLIGIYGGFLQAGTGFPLIALLVLFLGRSPVEANGVKMALVLGFTMLSLPTFAFAGKVDWINGLWLGGGMMLGAWLGSHWQLRSGAGIVRIFVIVMIVISGLLMLRP